MEQISILSSPLWLTAADTGKGLTGPEAFDDMDIAQLDVRFQRQKVHTAFGDDATAALAVQYGGTEVGVAGWKMMADEQYRDALAAADDVTEGHRRFGCSGAARFEGDGSVRGLRNAAVSLGYALELHALDDQGPHDMPAVLADGGDEQRPGLSIHEDVLDDIVTGAEGPSLEAGPVSGAADLPDVPGSYTRALVGPETPAALSLGEMEQRLHMGDAQTELSHFLVGGDAFTTTPAQSVPGDEDSGGRDWLLALFDDPQTDTFVFRSPEEREIAAQGEQGRWDADLPFDEITAPETDVLVLHDATDSGHDAEEDAAVADGLLAELSSDYALQYANDAAW
ncbi:hypothetical protein GCM10011415_29300 [Salipiger pallidus]|uniref:Uncharacterized protein n=1 Tax=Salipiger pallidus TaxID=1775170 RepID=A0A8J2ZLS7_9RHOB|nr:hypothetical protein [Salipiger pallidus]GGG78454.1 hypothetical protein GCM10011415_29300 [Salipiger pallidus]